MILEFSLDYRSSSLLYERLFMQTLEVHKLEGKITKEGFRLKLYVEAASVEALEAFVTDFTATLPHSIFLYESKAQIVESMPETGFEVPEGKKLPLPFCPACRDKVMDTSGEDYYNIFTECTACGYSTEGEARSYKEEFTQCAEAIKEGKIIELDTFYGTYRVGIPAAVCNEVPCDIVAYDLATIEKYANVSKHEVMTLGAFEKPLIRLKKKIRFTMDYEEVEADLIRFKLPDDFVLHCLMESLHTIGIDIVFVTKSKIPVQVHLHLVDYKEVLDPIEVVSSENSVAIVSGEKGLPVFPVNAEEVNPAIGAMHSVIREHHLEDDIVAGIYLSREHRNNILVRGNKFGIVEYLSLNFQYTSIHEVFDAICATDENGKKLTENYYKKFPEHFEKMMQITFTESELNIFKLWGVVSIVLGYSESSDLFEAAGALEDNVLSFLGEKGPRIDYKLKNIDGKPYLDPLMTIRTAMSFRLAGVDPLMLSYGVIESFLEFIANELDELKQNMNITAVTVAGSLLSNKQIFAKMSKEISINHHICFNNELPVDGNNIFYGGTSLS